MTERNGIITEQRSDDWIAYLKGNKQIWEAGSTEEEAIGKLWITASDQIIARAIRLYSSHTRQDYR